MKQSGRTLAIGDIHGCLDPLKLMWDTINPQPSDTIIFVGDYIDRGTDSKGVIDFLIELRDSERFNLTFLSGNHEEKFFLSRFGGSELADWLAHWGGTETLESYCKDDSALSLDAVPPSHWKFLLQCKPYFETANHIFVHANIEADVPLPEQLPFTLIHKKFGSPLPHYSGKTMICGHTAQVSHLPADLDHAICIDTDPGRGGWLTCLDVEARTGWQTNLNGDSRTIKL